MFNKKTRLYKLLFLSSFSIIFLTGFLLTFSVNVFAEGSIYFPMRQNQNNIYTERDITQINNYLNGNSYYYFCWVKQIASGNHQYYYVKWPKSSSNAGIIATTSGYQFALSYYGSTTFTYGYIDVKTQSNYHGYYENYIGNNPTQYIQGNKTSSVYSTTVSYLSNIGIYDSSNVDTRHVVLIYGDYIEVPTQGHSQGYMNNIPQFGYPIGMHPTSAPTVPIYTQPTLTNPPTIDTTDVKSVLESIFDLLAWVLNAILSYLGSIIQTLIDWFEFMSNLAIWIADFIKQCFVALMDFLYNNFTNLFAPLFNFLTGIFNFLFNENDQLSVYDLIKQFKTVVTNWFNNYWSNSFISGFWTNFESSLGNAFNYFSKIVLFFTSLVALGTDSSGEFAMGTLINNLFLPNPVEVAVILYQNDEFDVFSTTVTILQAFPILFNQLISVTPSATIHIPSLIYHGKQIGDFDVDFSWYATYKVYVDVILNAFLIIGYLYWLFITFGSHLRGHFIDYEPNNPDSNARLFRG